MTDPAQILDVLTGACSRALGRTLHPTELNAFSKYLQILTKWQKTQRLVACDDPAWIASHLVADSLLFSRAMPGSVERVVDIGSGAGFPGIPLRIVMPEVSFTLVESRQRRASFLRAAVRELGLANTEVIDQRLESLASRLTSVFDVAVMRCAGDPERLLPLTLPVLRPGGVVVASGPPPDALAGEAGGRRHRRTRPGAASGVSGFERVLVPGADGRPRQFLVARKS